MEHLDIHYFGEVQLTYERKEPKHTKITSSRMASEFICSRATQPPRKYVRSLYE